MKALVFCVIMFCSGLVFAQQTTNSAGTLDPTQTYNTGNLVLPTVSGTNSTPWVNGVYQEQLTCWAWGNPGYCGPNAIVRPGNNINFSFGSTDLYQVHAISSVLPNSGSGLRVNGYNYGFTAKNGNGWDNGGLDALSAYVAFIGADGNQVFYKNYNLNYKFNWTTFNFSETFDQPFATKDLSTVRYGFIGRDNNFWAGPYGPEVTNVTFSLKYSVDQCAINVLSSPTCPGYLDTLAKLTPASTAILSDPITSTSTSPTTTTTIVADPVSASVNVTSTTTVGQPSVIAPVVSTSAPATSSTTSSTNSSASSQSTKESSNSTNNTSLALSIINKNSERDAAGAAVAQSAVSQAQAVAMQAQQEAQSVAQSAVANSTSSSPSMVGGQSFSGSGIKVSNDASFSLQSSSISIASITMNNQSYSSNATQVNGSGLASQVVQMEQQQVRQEIISSSAIQTSSETYALLPSNPLTDRTNPLNDIMEQRQILIPSNIPTFTGPVVNKNAQDNEIAGGVNINRMALAPTGYSDYLNFTLRDANFYAPKEVYKNQKNVDNIKALRQLTNDTRHQEMVEQQYRR